MPPARILILEDSALFAMALQDELERRGHAVECAATLAAAREILQAGPVAAALLDMRLPDGNALNLARNLQAAGSCVALVTGLSPEQIEDDLSGLAVFSKPVSIDKLADWVDNRAAGGRN